MAVQIDMEMPKGCNTCPFRINEDEVGAYAQCLLLPIKDLDNNIVCYQKVEIRIHVNKNNKRSKHCPLKG